MNAVEWSGTPEALEYVEKWVVWSDVDGVVWSGDEIKDAPLAVSHKGCWIYIHKPGQIIIPSVWHLP